MKSGLKAYIINEGGDVKQDKNYNNGINPSPDSTASENYLNWTYIHPARPRGSTKGSAGCPTTRRFSDFDRAVQNKSDGTDDYMVIFR
jgi:hypothetical protein